MDESWWLGFDIHLFIYKLRITTEYCSAIYLSIYKGYDLKMVWDAGLITTDHSAAP